MPEYLRPVTLPGDPTAALHAATKQYIDTAVATLVAQALVDAKGDLLVGTADNTVARKAVGGANDMLVPDSSTADGLRWDVSRGSELAFAREAMGLLCANCAMPATSLALSASFRTTQVLVGRLPSGTAIGSVKLRTTAAQSGGAATMALYGATSLSATSWSRLGSNTVITSSLTSAADFKSIAYSATVSDDMWLRLMIVWTTAPSTWPTLSFAPSPVSGVMSPDGHPLCGTSSASAAPGATLDPSTGWTAAGLPAIGLAA